jgi:hypothetical protein
MWRLAGPEALDVFDGHLDLVAALGAIYGVVPGLGLLCFL